MTYRYCRPDNLYMKIAHMKPIRVIVILITLLRYTYVHIVQLSINICKLCRYSGSIAVTITKLHSIYKCIHNCTVYWCPIMALFISVHNCTFNNAPYWYSLQCSGISVMAQFITVPYWYSLQCSGISIIAQFINVPYWYSLQCSGISVSAQFIRGS